MRYSGAVFSIVLMVLLLAACQRVPDPTPLPRSISTVDVPGPAEMVVDVTFVEAAPAESLPNECLNCHSDKQRLIDTAKEEEVVVSESEGVG